MDPFQLIALKSQLEDVCRSVAAFIREELTRVRYSDIQTKDRNSLVSYVDKEAEKILVSALSSLAPGAGFITEENTVARESKSLMWVIDPLDGTSNFLYNIPHFSISVALMENDKVVLGVVYEIMQDRPFSAVLGCGAWENGQAVHVSNRTLNSDAIVVTGFPYEREFRIDDRLSVLKCVIENYRGIRRLGSAALDLAYVASGRFDIYYENTLNIWDIAAGALIVKEAGGVITDYSGNANYLNNGEVIACAPPFYQDISTIISKHLL